MNIILKLPLPFNDVAGMFAVGCVGCLLCTVMLVAVLVGVWCYLLETIPLAQEA